MASASRLKSSTTLKVRKRLPQTSESCIKSMDQLWLIASGVASGAGLRTGRCCFSLTAKIQFQQTVNPVNAFMVPGVTLPAQQLKQLLKTIPRVALRQFSQHLGHRFITPGIGLIKIHLPAQR